jgi:hypothetical protein
MTTATLFPFEETEVVELGEGLWKTKILPFGTIRLSDGRDLKVDHNYIRPVMEAFSAGAFDQISLQMADENNKHTDDPERHRGEITGLEVADDGLYASVRTTPEGTETLKKNRKLGRSVRILDGYVRHDGKVFKRALHHVLATLSPRVQGMGRWELVKEFSHAAAEWDVLDLTESSPLPVSSGGGDTGGGGMPDIAPDELDAMTQSAEDDFAEQELGRVLGDNPELADGLGTRTELSDSVALELTELRKVRKEMREDLQRERAKNELTELAHAGVWPALLKLAQPILEAPDVPVIELSDNTTVNPAAVVRAMLDECRGMVQLGVRMGSPDTRSEEQIENDILTRWEQESQLSS